MNLSVRQGSVKFMANLRQVKMVAKKIMRDLSDMLFTDTVLQHAVLPETLQELTSTSLLSLPSVMSRSPMFFRQEKSSFRHHLILRILSRSITFCVEVTRYLSITDIFSKFGVSGTRVVIHRMSSPNRRCSLKGKAIATASDSDSSGSPLIRQSRSIAIGGMDNSGPTTEDLADLDNNERNIVEFGLELKEREASGQVPEDDPTLDFEPRSEQEIVPTEAGDATGNQETLTQKKIDYALADLLPMRWTGTDFKFDEQIDPEQERRFSVKKNQKWENHLPTKSTFKSVRRLILQTDPPAGFSILLLTIHQRPWTPPAGYACVYESWFLNCSLWWPLPEFLTTYCSKQKIALGQYTANGIRILVTLSVLATELGIKMSACLLEELTTPSITMKTGFFYGKMVPQYNVITGKPTKVNFWNHRYFYIKINEAFFEDPSIILNGYFNANIDRLSKWSQGGTQSFLEEEEAIRTLSHQHWPDISEARIQAALNRINRAAFTSPIRSSRMGKLNLAFLPSYADTIGTPVHGDCSSGAGRPAKRKRSAKVEEEARQTSPAQSPYTEGPT
ncbi:hypothetical protein N665_0218s0030 [Sinapis alba]|nr:hypothetical protein N665_0218s0030 [Sinapis alba]